MKKRHFSRSKLQSFAALGAVTVVLLPIILSSASWPTVARDYLAQNGVSDSGAPNLVSAIYLGYRAFDTLGETIVLMVAVIGTMRVLNRAEDIFAEEYGASDTGNRQELLPKPLTFTLPGEKRESHALRTHLLEVVTGKLGPVVLLFGFYVMMYGHLSPGGGFQGGAIIASGIIFLALGNQKDSPTRLSGTKALSRMEAIAFFLLILASMSGIPLGKGFFGNPLEDVTSFPAGFIILLNAIIGVKVGAGIGLMCIAMMGKKTA